MGLPPFKISSIDGSFGQRPVFELEISGGTLTPLSAIKARLGIPTLEASTAGAPTNSPYITYGADAVLSNEKTLTAGSSVTTHTDATSFYVNAITNNATGFTSPLAVDSGGTGRTTVGDYASFMGVSGGAFHFLTLIGGNNVSVTSAGTAVTLAATTNDISGKQDSLTIPLIVGSGGTGLDAVGPYATLLGVSGGAFNFLKLIGGNNLSVTSAGTAITLAATTNDISGKQDSLTIPLIVGSGGTGLDAVGDYASLLGVSGGAFNFLKLIGGDNVTVSSAGTAITIAATTNDISGKQDSLTIPLIVGSGGTGLDAVGPYASFLGVSGGGYNFLKLVGGNSVTVTSSGTAVTLAATTSDVSSLVSNTRLVSAGTGLTGGGDLSADRTFSVNSNVRDKLFSFFLAGNLAGGKAGEDSRIYIPFNQEILDIRGAVATSSVGASLDVTLNQHPTPDGAASVVGSAVFSATAYVASNNSTFTQSTLFSGSWLGVLISKSGSTLAGSNLTVTILTRTS